MRYLKHGVFMSQFVVETANHFVGMYPVSWGAPHEAMASSQEFKTQNHLLSQLSNMALDFMYVGTGLHFPQLGLEHRIHSTFCPGSTLVFLPALVRLSFFSDSPIELSLLTQYLKYGRSYGVVHAMIEKQMSAWQKQSTKARQNNHQETRKALQMVHLCITMGHPALLIGSVTLHPPFGVL